MEISRASLHFDVLKSYFKNAHCSAAYELFRGEGKFNPSLALNEEGPWIAGGSARKMLKH